MAHKRGRKRSMKGYTKGVVNEALALSTLAPNTLISALFDEAPVERMLASSLVATWSIDDLLAGQGPLIFGVAHSDYTDAEIEAYIENAGSWDTGDKIAQEVGKRLVRIIGSMVGEQGTGTDDVRFNSGRPIKTKLNWMLNTGDTLRLWAYNKDTGALTLNAILNADGHINLWSR